MKNLSKNCLFISPHLDDFVLSCSSFAQSLLKRGYKIQVVTVFTKGTIPPYTHKTSWYLKTCGFKNATSFFAARKKENETALAALKVPSVNLDFTDGLFRKEGPRFIYPELSVLFLRHAEEERLKQQLLNRIRNLAKKLFKKGPATIFLPLGIGNHVDHVISRETLEDNFTKVIFYEDFPYNQDRKAHTKFFRKNRNYKLLFSIKTHQRKQNFARIYKTQFYALFPFNNFPNHKEIFWKKAD